MNRTLFIDGRIRLIQEDEFVVIYNDELNLWEMPLHYLAYSYDVLDGVLGSGHILDLNEKKWCKLPLLYTLAKFISDIHPVNPIDWYQTFFSVEMRRYRLEALRLQRLAAGDKTDDLPTHNAQQMADGFKQHLDMASELNDEASSAIEKVVRDSLRRYQIA